MGLRRILLCSAATLVAALALVQAGAASREDTVQKTHLGTYHCSQKSHYFEYHLPAGGRFLFHVEHHWAGVRFEVGRRAGYSEWAETWGWYQPTWWIIGTYHVMTNPAAAGGEFDVRLSTQTTHNAPTRNEAGTCTVQIYAITP